MEVDINSSSLLFCVKKIGMPKDEELDLIYC